jgi:AcrR family transcriptional regulator
VVAEPVPSPDAQVSRIVEGALRALSRYGLAKLTLDDVAREAGCSRATLYRYFPGKGALLQAVVASETARLRAGLDAALSDVTDLGEALAAVGTFGARQFAGHEALQFLLANEPGAVLPHLCSGPGGRLLDLLAGVVAPHLCRFLPPLQARRVAEWLARIVLSYACTPPPGESPARAEAAVEAVVREFVVPGLGDGRASG